ncbi:TolC family protein [bacterium]|nr:TolC family protein [bacterium]
MGERVFADAKPPHAKDDSTQVRTVEQLKGERIARAKRVSREDEVLRLEEVLQSVARHHPLLRSEVLGIEAADARTLSARGSYDPKVKSKSYSYLSGYYSGAATDNRIEVPVAPAFGNVFGGFRRGAGELPVYEDEYQTLSNGEFGFGVSFSLLRNLFDDRRKLGIDLARLDRDLSELGYTSAQIKLQQAAVQHYWTWVIQGKIAAIFRGLLHVAEERQKQLDLQVQAGSLAEFESLDNRRSILQRRAKVLKQEALLVEAAQALSLFVRQPSGAPRVATAQEIPRNLPRAVLVENKPEQLLAEAFQQRVDLEKLQTKSEILERKRSFEKTRLLPELELASSITRDYGSGSETREGTESKIFLNVEVPLVQRTARGKIQAAEAELSQVKTLTRFLQEQIRAEIPVFLNQIRQSYQRYEVSIQEWNATRRLEEGEKTRFSSGDSNLLFLAMRELAAAEARVHVLEALGENFAYRAKLDAALGRTVLNELTEGKP